MALFELNIYGQNDEILKSYKTDKVRWGVYLEALNMSEDLEDKTYAEQFKLINDFVKQIFPELTDEELSMADGEDVMNTFKQLMRKAERIGGKQKNATRAAAQQ